MNIFAIAGSLRRASYNYALIRAAAGLAPAGMTIDVAEAAAIGDLPLINEDLEEGGRPAPVEALRARVRSADALMLAVPEYNSAVAAPLKNAIDWLSRGEPGGGKHPLWQKPVAILGAATGMGGTVRAQGALHYALQRLGAFAMPVPELLVGGAADKFDAAGTLTDATTIKLLGQYLEAFAAWTLRVRS